MAADEGVRRYIDTKRAVIRNMGRLQDQFYRLQGMTRTVAGIGDVYREIQKIIDDPFADGSPASP